MRQVTNMTTDSEHFAVREVANDSLDLVHATKHGDGVAQESLEAILHPLVTRSLNLLGALFIQAECVCCNKWRLPEEMGFDGCLRAFSAKSRNMILTFLSP